MILQEKSPLQELDYGGRSAWVGGEKGKSILDIVFIEFYKNKTISKCMYLIATGYKKKCLYDN